MCPQLSHNAFHFGDEAEMKKKASGMPGEKMSIDYSKAVVIYASRKPLTNVIPANLYQPRCGDNIRGSLK